MTSHSHDSHDPHTHSLGHATPAHGETTSAPAAGALHDDHADEGHGSGAGDVEHRPPLGPPKRLVAIGGGVELAVVDVGDGPAILFIHGIPTSAVLWRRVIAAVGPGYRCIAADLLGFGDSDGPPGADLSLEAQARYQVALLDALGVSSATVVGHDVGGGVAQILAIRHGDRVARLVLTNCIAYDNWPVAAVKPMLFLAKRSFIFDLAVETGLVERYARSRFGLRAGLYRPDALDEAVIGEYLRPLYRDAAPAYRESRERIRRFFLATEGVAPQPTLEIAGDLRRLETPTLVVWGTEDRFLSVSWAKKLADEIPGCSRLELIPFAGHFWPEEKPAEFAVYLGEFMRTPPSPSARVALGAPAPEPAMART